MEVIITENEQSMGRIAAQYVFDLLNEKPNAVLGLATGSTPIPIYRELIEAYRNGVVDYARITTFNLDEYVGLPQYHPQSFSYFMREHLFEEINVPEQSIHIPSGTSTNHTAFCRWYEDEIKRSGGIDLQLLGIGCDGHIAFNEPGSSLGSRTRMKTLSQQTIEDNARFFDSIDQVPRYAITMGVGTILDARHCLLVASGEAKAEPIAHTIEGPVSASHTASALQLHPKVTVVVDEAAASKLSNRDYYKWAHKNTPSVGLH